MAKKTTTNKEEEARYQSRDSRKEILRARKQDEQLRVVRVGAIIVGIIIVAVLLLALINEYIIAPNRSVATVHGEDISLSDWQKRVVFERAQRIVTLENQLELFNGDVGPIQQFASQPIIELQNAEGLGEAVIEQMVNEELIHQGAENRDLIPADEEIDERIGASFNYFGGDSPTPIPAPTETIVPTPSLTPISGADDSAEAPAVVPDDGPTSTPLPTPTPVSEASFEQEYSVFISGYTDIGADEEVYRQLVGTTLMAERLTDALAEEQSLATEDTHASFYLLAFNDQDIADETQAEINEGDFLTVWNNIRSQVPDPESTEPPPANASEVLWRTQDSLTNSFNADLAVQAMELELNTPSEVITIVGSDGEAQHLIIMVSGREIRELSANELSSREQQLLFDFITEQRLEDVEIFDLWRQRVPVLPALDPKFLQPPTPAPEVPVLDPSGGTDSGLPETP